MAPLAIIAPRSALAIAMLMSGIGGITGIVGITGSRDEKDRRRAIEAGCDEVLLKPVTPDTFERLIG